MPVSLSFSKFFQIFRFIIWDKYLKFKKIGHVDQGKKENILISSLYKVVWRIPKLIVTAYDTMFIA